MGENVTTSGVELLELPTGARLKIGEEAVVEVTGLREPCVQMDKFQKGLMKAVIGRKDDGRVQMRSGIMGIVIESGMVRVGDGIEVELPVGPFRELVCV
jgi:MOSC domain-containing protein YiiM